jgi:hypothetical protein
MPRTQKSPAEITLGFFRSAPLEVARLVLDLAKGAVRERMETPAPASKPTAVAAVATHKAKPAKTAAPTAARAKSKPGPKPGSHRKQRNGGATATATAAADRPRTGRVRVPRQEPQDVPLDLREPIQDDDPYLDPDYAPPDPGSLPDFTTGQ